MVLVIGVVPFCHFIKLLIHKLNALLSTFEDFRELFLHGTLGSTGAVQPSDESWMSSLSEKAHDGSIHWLVRSHAVWDKTYTLSL